MGDKSAIVYVQDYLQSSNKVYSNYEDFVDYINNKSKTKEFDEYESLIEKMTNDSLNDKSENFVDYINSKSNDSDKTQFSAFNFKDKLSDYEIDTIKNNFGTSREKGNNLYRGVFSFGNDFLLEQNIINEKRELINKEALIKCVQNGMKELNKESRIGFRDMEWIANFHFNTNHIHCHVAYIDKKEDKYSRSDKQRMVINTKGFESVKSRAINSLVNNNESYMELTKQRDEVRAALKNNQMFNDFNKVNSIPLDLYEKYGKKLLYLNTRNSQFTKEEYQDVKMKLREYFLNDENELNNKSIKSIFNEYEKSLEDINKKNIEYYGNSKNNNYVENKLLEIDKTMLAIARDTFRELYNNENEIMQVIDDFNEEFGDEGVSVAKSMFNKGYQDYKKASNDLMYLFKKGVYEELNEKHKINMKAFYKSQRERG